MPIYEYACEDCGIFQMLRPMSERRLAAACPSCRQAAMRVLLTAPGMVSNVGSNHDDGASPRHAGVCGCCTKVSFPSEDGRVRNFGDPNYALGTPAVKHLLK